MIEDGTITEEQFKFIKHSYLAPGSKVQLFQKLVRCMRRHIIVSTQIYLACLAPESSNLWANNLYQLGHTN